LGTTRLRGRPRNRWQDGVRGDGRIVGGEGWQEKVHNRKEWKKLLRMARNRRILHMPMERMNGMLLPLKFFVKLQCQFSGNFSYYWVLFKLSFFMLYVNFLIAWWWLFTSAETCSKQWKLKKKFSCDKRSILSFCWPSIRKGCHR